MTTHARAIQSRRQTTALVRHDPGLELGRCTTATNASCQIDGLTVAFPTRDGLVKGVDDITFAVGSHERVGIVGESGSGKSVMGLAMLGLVLPPGRMTGGEILWKGESMLDPAVQSRVRVGRSP